MKHLADHRSATTGARLRHYLRLARDKSESAWEQVWQKAPLRGPGNRRVVEYVRIERGRST